MSAATLDHDALLKAVIADPADDLPRLAFADWCEENGDPLRAEFVRVQIAIAEAERDCRCGRKGGNHRFAGGQHTNGPCAGDQVRWAVGDTRGPARLRERQLLERINFWGNAAAAAFGLYDWEDATGGTKADDSVKWEFRRGFVAAVRCTLADWLSDDHGARCVAACPLERVELTGRSAIDGKSWMRLDAKYPPAPPVADASRRGNYCLPREVWDALAGHQRELSAWGVLDGPNLKRYADGSRAISALSDALLLTARRQAGLAPAD